MGVVRYFGVVLFVILGLVASVPFAHAANPKITFTNTPVQVSIEGKVYRFAYAPEIDPKTQKAKPGARTLVLFGPKGHLVADKGVLEKAFFTAFVYRPYFNDSGQLPLGPGDLRGYRDLEWKRTTLQAMQTALLFREVGTRALVNAMVIAATGGASAPKTFASIGKEIAKRTAVHLVQSALADPVAYLQAVVSATFEQSIKRWKVAEAKFNSTKRNRVLKYKDAKEIFESLCFGQAYGDQSIALVTRLVNQKAGGGDLYSQLVKLGKYSIEELTAGISQLYRPGVVVTTGMVGLNIYDFLVSKVPEYGNYVALSKKINDGLLDYKSSKWWQRYWGAELSKATDLATNLFKLNQNNNNQPVVVEGNYTNKYGVVVSNGVVSIRGFKLGLSLKQACALPGLDKLSLIRCDCNNEVISRLKKQGASAVFSSRPDAKEYYVIHFWSERNFKLVFFKCQYRIRVSSDTRRLFSYLISRLGAWDYAFDRFREELFVGNDNNNVVKDFKKQFKHAQYKVTIFDGKRRSEIIDRPDIIYSWGNFYCFNPSFPSPWGKGFHLRLVYDSLEKRNIVLYQIALIDFDCPK